MTHPRDLYALTVICFAVLILAAGSASGEDDANRQPSPRDSRAERLVRSGLEAGLLGDESGRRVKLKAARSLAPTFAASYWHLGYVRVGDEWKTIAEAEELARADRVLGAYAKQREKLAGNAKGEAQLAAWCRRNDLTEQALAHWYQVLRYNPSDKRALRAMEATWYHGVLLKVADAEQQRQRDEILQDDLAAAESKIKTWREMLGSGDQRARASVFEQLRELRGEIAIRIISQVLLRPTSDEELTITLQVQAMEMLETHDISETASILTWHATLSKFDAVRDAARRQLRERQLHEFVPVLLAGLQMPLEVSVRTEVVGRRADPRVTVQQEGAVGVQQGTYQGVFGPVVPVVPISYRYVRRVL